MNDEGVPAVNKQKRRERENCKCGAQPGSIMHQRPMEKETLGSRPGKNEGKWRERKSV